MQVRNLLDRLVTVRAGGGRHALAVVWLARERAAGRRLDPILPRLTVDDVDPARKRGALLGEAGPLADRGERMPLLPEVARDDVRVPILELADVHGVQSMARGRGAPLELRLAVEALLSFRLDERWEDTIRIAWRVADLLDAVKPNPTGRRRGGGDPRRGGRPDDWTRVQSALKSLDEKAWVPWAQPSGRPGVWRLFAIRGLPDVGKPGPEDKVVIEVALPPGAGAGAVVDRLAIRQAGLVSAPAFRALIGVSTLTWMPGRTRVPVSGAGGLWTGAVARYPVLSARDRRRVAFGPRMVDDTRGLPQSRVDAAWRATEGVVIVDENARDATGKRGWRVVLPAAANAIDARRKRAGEV